MYRLAMLLIGFNILLAIGLFVLRHDAESEYVAQHQSVGSDIVLVEELEPNDPRLITWKAEQEALTNVAASEESVEPSYGPGLEEAPSSSAELLPATVDSGSEGTCDWVGPFDSKEEISRILLTVGLDETVLWSEQVEKVSAYQVILNPAAELVQSVKQTLSDVGIESYALESSEPEAQTEGIELAAGLFSEALNAENVRAKIETLGLPVDIRPVERLEDVFWVVTPYDLPTLMQLVDALGGRPFQIVEKSCPEVAS